MKKLIIFSVLIFYTQLLSAQFGINAGYRSNGGNNWEKYLEDQDFIKSGYKVGIDYWFRLKNKRVEFTPELAYSSFKSENTLPNALPDQNEVTAKSNIYSLYLNTNIYFLDLENDCNCPTWSKSNDFVKKGLFLQVTPGLNYLDNLVEDPAGLNENATDFVFSLGGGLGVDIGVSNMITVTPMLSYHYYFNANWDGLAEQLGENFENNTANETTDLQQFFAGIRVGIRLDQRNYGFR